MTAITARIAQGVTSIAAEDWDACAGDANPFVGHAFLAALEASKSVGGRSGWQALPVVVDGDDGRPAGIAPAYAKSHSQGEYVFDQGWADAWERAGGQYYPKLQIAAPFSPVPGPRLLLPDPAVAPALFAALGAERPAHAVSRHLRDGVLDQRVPVAVAKVDGQVDAARQKLGLDVGYELAVLRVDGAHAAEGAVVV